MQPEQHVLYRGRQPCLQYQAIVVQKPETGIPALPNSAQVSIIQVAYQRATKIAHSPTQPPKTHLPTHQSQIPKSKSSYPAPSSDKLEGGYYENPRLGFY
ncbi:hypothetical protein BT63DRAFT_422583 [Microthyrium microscopicum]|uniref:Uncharacterized protein n=1 Tax=Microthyrium microscopicum TaxID=703497 RepID=A0A6A6ULW4_9PEZI|nr:hypothetical protein BT63DRAFT_422583 [Microthyrium microscopicum]